MVKMTNCKAIGCGVDFSLPADMVITCIDCGHSETISKRMSGSISCPVCKSINSQITDAPKPQVEYKGAEK